MSGQSVSQIHSVVWTLIMEYFIFQGELTVENCLENLKMARMYNQGQRIMQTMEFIIK